MRWVLVWARRLLCLTLAVCVLSGCGGGKTYAPVVDISELGTFMQKKFIRDVAVKQNITSTWVWPAEGVVELPFSKNNKGIDIAGKPGEPVYAAAAGTVVYSGNGLRNYGYLIILKHNNVYMSAYAYNRATLVKSGQWVKQGQKIAEMGKTATKRSILHFEIRRYGQAIDPLSLLDKLSPQPFKPASRKVVKV